MSIRFIVLTGPKHSGKTSAGSALADLLGLPFHDLDEIMEQQTGKSPRALYAEGTAVFRAAEAAALRAALAVSSGAAVLAAGGGVIDNPEAVRALRSPEVFIACLEVNAGTAWKRIASGPLPPFLENGTDDPEKTHRELHERRAAAYRKLAARNGVIIQAEEKTPRMIAQELAQSASRIAAEFGPNMQLYENDV